MFKIAIQMRSSLKWVEFIFILISVWQGSSCPLSGCLKVQSIPSSTAKHLVKVRSCMSQHWEYIFLLHFINFNDKWFELYVVKSFHIVYM